MLRCTANRGNGKQSPCLYFFSKQISVNLFQFINIPLIHTGHYIKINTRGAGSQD